MRFPDNGVEPVDPYFFVQDRPWKAIHPISRRRVSTIRRSLWEGIKGLLFFRIGFSMLLLYAPF